MKLPRMQPTLGLLLLLGFAAYIPSFVGRFQFDDFYLIVQNPTLASLPTAWHSLPESLRPLTKLTLALNMYWHGLRPFGFHLVNLGIHLASGFFLYRILCRIPGAVPNSTEHGFSIAWLATAIFLLHPAQTEAVTYISGRSSSLMTACLLLALWLALRPSPSAPQDLPWRGASLAAFLAAVLAKEVALIFPLLYLIWLLTVERKAVRQALILTAPYASLSLVLLLGIFFHPRYHELIIQAASRLPWPQAGLSQLRAVMELLGVLVFPWRVNIDHALPAARSFREVWPHLVILLGVALWAARSWRSAPLITGGLLWGFAALLPTHSLLVREDLMADRLLYLPMAGFSLAAAAWLAGTCAAAGRHLPRAALWPALTVTVALLLGIAATQRNLLYRSEIALWSDCVAKSPQNPRAHHNLGYAYELNGDPEKAVREYRAALALQPENGHYWQSLGIALNKLMVEGHAADPPPRQL